MAGIIAGAITASYTVAWLLGALSSSGTTNNNLSGGNLPNLGGAPLPPPLNPTQNNGAIPPEGTPPPIPTLEEILANAGYPPEEQAGQQASEPLEQPSSEGAQGATAPQPDDRPPCPDEMVFVFPMVGNQDRPSQTRQALNDGEATKHCSGQPPKISFKAVYVGLSRHQCRDTATQRPTTSCTIPDPAYQCPAGERLEPCSDVRQNAWAEAAGGACLRAQEFGQDTQIILEGTHTLQERGEGATPEEAQAFEADLRQFCGDGTEIYSEDTPFDGATPWTEERVRFGSTPEDVFRRRQRAEYWARQE
ncbi:MAG: hypothetical protein ACRC9R_13070, partial [Enterovibrio sp.]